MSWLTPEQEAAHALESGIARSDLSERAKLAYDWLVQHVDARAQPPSAASTGGKPSQADSVTGSAASSPLTPAATTGDAPSQAASVTGSAASSPPAPAATAGDEPLAVEPLTGFTGEFPMPGLEEGTVDANQLWGADFGTLNEG